MTRRSLNRVSLRRAGLRSLPERGAKCESIAIIGMAGRFPDAPDLETFWQNLAKGVESPNYLLRRRDTRFRRGPRDTQPHPDYVKRTILEGAESGLTQASSDSIHGKPRSSTHNNECFWNARGRRWRMRVVEARWREPVGRRIHAA